MFFKFFVGTLELRSNHPSIPCTHWKIKGHVWKKKIPLASKFSNVERTNRSSPPCSQLWPSTSILNSVHSGTEINNNIGGCKIAELRKTKQRLMESLLKADLSHSLWQNLERVGRRFLICCSQSTFGFRKVDEVLAGLNSQKELPWNAIKRFQYAVKTSFSVCKVDHWKSEELLNGKGSFLIWIRTNRIILIPKWEYSTLTVNKEPIECFERRLSLEWGKNWEMTLASG